MEKQIEQKMKNRMETREHIGVGVTLSFYRDYITPLSALGNCPTKALWGFRKKWSPQYGLQNDRMLILNTPEKKNS